MHKIVNHTPLYIPNQTEVDEAVEVEVVNVDPMYLKKTIDPQLIHGKQ